MASFQAAQQGNGVFSPAIWSKELIIARESILSMANNVLRLDSDVAENGYVINIPSISNLSASLIGADGSLADQAPTETALQLTVNQWLGVSINVPDILAVQSKYDLMKLYAEKMGYALGVAIEDDLLGLYSSAANFTGTSAVDLVDSVIRRAVQYLDDARVPMSERHLILKPSQRNALLGIDKFVRYDSVSYKPGESPIVKGDIGEIYGVLIHISPEVFLVSSTTHNIMWHKEAIALAMQKDIKVEKFARTNFADRMGASELFGFVAYRPDHMVDVRS
jgi:hypothetical protein